MLDLLGVAVASAAIGGEWECRATVLSEDDDIGNVRRQRGGGEVGAPRVEPADSDQVIQRDACCVRLPGLTRHEHGLLERTGCLSNEFDADTSSPKGFGERVGCWLLFWRVEDRYDQRRFGLCLRQRGRQGGGGDWVCASGHDLDEVAAVVDAEDPDLPLAVVEDLGVDRWLYAGLGDGCPAGVE